MSEQTKEKPDLTRRHDAEHIEVLTDKELDATIAQIEQVQGVRYDDGDEPAPEKTTSGETPPASSEAPATEEPAAPPTLDKELDSALTALKRTQGLSDTALDNMSREDVLALAAPLKENRSQMDEIQRQLAELRKDTETKQIGSEDSEALGAPATEEHPSTETSTLPVGLEALADEFGKEGADAVAAVITPLLDEIKSLKGMVGDVVSDSRTTAAQGVLNELADGAYPQLKRAEAREAVQSHAARLVEEGAAPNARTAVLQASRVFYGEGQAPEDPIQSAREQGVVSTGEYSGAHQERELSQDELADKLLYDAMDRQGL